MGISCTTELVISQENDTWSRTGDFQFLRIKTELLGDNDGFLVVETERWAINNISELIKELEEIREKLRVIYPTADLSK